MNKILNLFDNKEVHGWFNQRVLPLYPDFKSIKKIKIVPHKNLVWTTTYHVVIEFKTVFINSEGKDRILSIFCTAHSSEPRKNVFDGLSFLWNEHFSRGFLTVPRPLFYDEYYNATFYRGVKGKNLYHFIKEKKFAVIENIIPQAAHWFLKLHSLKSNNVRNFNQENSRINTTFPGLEHIYNKIEVNCPHYLDVFKKIYTELMRKEEEFLSSTDRRWLVYGDAHPENVIKISENKIAVIDFTDLCLSDFARDLGSFTQQLDYMSDRKIGKKKYSEKIKKLFLDSYFNNSKIKLDDGLERRIANYYNWTAMRTATYFLLKSEPEPGRAEPLINMVVNNFNIK